MGAEIIPLPGAKGAASPIAHYLRIGDSGHHQLENLLAEDRFPAKQVVVDASQFKYQKNLIAALRRSGVEIILDTKAAELSEPGKYSGFAANAPWALSKEGRMLGPDFYSATSSKDVVGEMARFAVEHEFDAILAPCHFLREGASDPWFDINRNACERLRRQLDNAGGFDVAIDYGLIIPHTHLRDEAIRGALVSGLANLPFDNLWVRASGFGGDGTPAGARHYINALSSLHNLGKPIIADHLGGLIGTATTAFGAASGVARGVGEKERFDARNWDKPPPKRKKGQPMGRANRLYIPALDKSLSVPELQALANARGGRRLLVCHDRECCPHGLEDMVKNWKAHILTQCFGSLQRLQRIPDLKRAEHFLKTDMAFADQQARQIKELKPVLEKLKPRDGETVSESGKKLMERLSMQARRYEKMRAVLENLHHIRGDSGPRVLPAVLRGGAAKKKQDKDRQ